MDFNLPGMSGIESVRRHIMAIYDKLHVNSRLDAVGKLGRV